MTFLFFCYVIFDRVFWPGVGDPFVSQTPRENYASNFQGLIVACVDSICQSSAQLTVNNYSHRVMPCLLLFQFLFATLAYYVTNHFLFLSIFTNPSAQAGYDTKSIFKRSLTGLNSEFSFSWASCLTKAEEPSLSYYLPIAGGRIFRFIPSPRVLVQWEMQSVRSMI